MRILIVNPNTTASMTEKAAIAARAVAAAGTEIMPPPRAWGLSRSRGTMTARSHPRPADPN
jgi:allantoin racemase